MASRLVVAIPDGSHSLVARLTLDRLSELPIEAHVIMPDDPARTLSGSDHLSPGIIEERAEETYKHGNIGAPMASGSWASYGMFLLPATDDVLRRIALGLSGDLITRTADVMLKERKTLVVVPFEEQWDADAIDHLITITETGGMVLPPFPSFYTGIDRIRPMVQRTVDRALSQFDFPVEIEEWSGIDGN